MTNGACAFYAWHPRLQTHTQNTWYLLLFHRNNIWTNLPQCYFAHTLLVLYRLFNFTSAFLSVWNITLASATETYSKHIVVCYYSHTLNLSSNPFWDPHIFNCKRGIFSCGSKRTGYKTDHSPHLAPRLSTARALFPLPLTPSWLSRGGIHQKSFFLKPAWPVTPHFYHTNHKHINLNKLSFLGLFLWKSCPIRYVLTSAQDLS